MCVYNKQQKDNAVGCLKNIILFLNDHYKKNVFFGCFVSQFFCCVASFYINFVIFFNYPKF